jgi:hypothetical protein
MLDKQGHDPLQEKKDRLQEMEQAEITETEQLVKEGADKKCIAIYNYCAGIMIKPSHTEKQRYAQSIAKMCLAILMQPDPDKEKTTEGETDGKEKIA